MTIDHIAAIRPGDADYDSARATKYDTGTPALILQPTSPGEVAESVRHAQAEGLPIAVRNGGHNALSYGTIDDGLIIDLSKLDQVEILGDHRVRIGGGATWGPSATELGKHGLAISSGDTLSVGVGGLTQAGGIGWMVRKHGLALDNLLAAEVVTASGDVVRASAAENEDLFWGLRGGAGNFGVVTALEFQAQPVTTVHFGTIEYALEDLDQLVKGWAATMRTAPDEFTATLALRPAFGPFPAAAILFLCLAGDDLAAIEPFRAIGKVVAEDISEHVYAEVLEEGPPHQEVTPVIGNAFVESVDEPLITAVTEAYSAGGRVVFLRGLGGAYGRVDPSATAFAHRRAEALIVSAAFMNPESTDADFEHARAVWRTIGDQGFGSYSGFLGSDTAEDIAALWPKDTLDRLREVKRAWDPDNVFRRNFNIAP
ncbi:FAD/FMN-containing dehydrogenase [Aeromicrobium panaciterrae]|uniref:FAD/FMN-containing dehydrogenase n=1 Tax=Aeromicrobium panaciterrae TaxID=363861 RepID=A0ABU1UJP7_9ACTN|nr:FAD-binding oxidoreductase [Aeromicrobium panaciterrae]MDR7085376.1 FAD/FMN-containing dehydrogenase [Aeromicrobium panaciterrae]